MEQSSWYILFLCTLRGSWRHLATNLLLMQCSPVPLRLPEHKTGQKMGAKPRMRNTAELLMQEAENVVLFLLLIQCSLLFPLFWHVFVM